MAQEQLRLKDGTIVRKCPTEKTLYCSREGKFYSVHRFRTGASYPCGVSLTDDGWVLREIKPTFSPSARTPGRACFNSKRGCVYPIMRNYANQLCHKLVALTWIGPRPEGYEIDHLNGDITNWSADNLEYVTPEENRRRARLLRVLRSIGRAPKQMSRDQLLELFTTNNVAGDVYEGE